MAVAEQKEKSVERRTVLSVFVFVPMTVNLIIVAMFVLGGAE